MKVLLVLIAVHVHNPNDIPGRAELIFDDIRTCERVLATLEYTLKFRSYKVIGECQKSY